MGKRRTRVLVILRGHIGDLVQATPALHAIRQHYPGARITVLANEYTRGLLEGSPVADEVIYGFAYEERSRIGRLVALGRLCARVALRFDVAISLRYSPRIAPVLSIVTGARVRAGFDGGGRFGRLLTHNAGREPKDVSNRVTNQRVLDTLGIAGSPAYRPLSWTGAAADSTRATLHAKGVHDDAFAVCQISCNWGCNQLADEKWATIIDHVMDVYGLHAVVIGAGDRAEREQFAAIDALTRHRPISLHGHTSLAELVELVRRSALVVATDSSLTQIALAEATPSVIMFGIEPMWYNGPLPEERCTTETIQHWDGPATAPTPNPHCRFVGSYCHGEHCRENSSLAATSVGEIIDHIAVAMRRRLPSSAASGPSVGSPTVGD